MKLVIVDDHVLFREGLAAIIRDEPDFDIIGLAGSVREVIEKIPNLQPDVVLMDFGLPDGTGVDATKAILAVCPACKVVFLTMYEDDESLFQAIRAGAKGYLLKNLHPVKLVEALRSVYRGESALSRSMTLRLMEELSRSQPLAPKDDGALSLLTSRELDVLRAIAAGLTNQEIACRLVLSENTIKFHVHSILEKLNLDGRRAAAEFAKAHGIK